MHVIWLYTHRECTKIKNRRGNSFAASPTAVWHSHHHRGPHLAKEEKLNSPRRKQGHEVTTMAPGCVLLVSPGLPGSKARAAVSHQRMDVGLEGTAGVPGGVTWPPPRHHTEGLADIRWQLSFCLQQVRFFTSFYKHHTGLLQRYQVSSTQHSHTKENRFHHCRIWKREGLPMRPRVCVNTIPLTMPYEFRAATNGSSLEWDIFLSKNELSHMQHFNYASLQQERMLFQIATEIFFIHIPSRIWYL